MKKILIGSATLIAILATSLILSSVLISLTISKVYALPVYQDSCVCDHWNENQVNTQYDEYTGTGVRSFYGANGYFYQSTIIFDCGTGGYYAYKPYSSEDCREKFSHTGISWIGYDTYNNYGAWLTGQTPFPGGSYHNYTERTYTHTYSYDYAYSVAGLTQNWFQSQSNPSTWWLCGSTWCMTFANGQ